MYSMVLMVALNTSAAAPAFDCHVVVHGGAGCVGSGSACSGWVACSGNGRCSGGLFRGGLFNRHRCSGDAGCSGWSSCSGAASCSGRVGLFNRFRCSGSTACSGSVACSGSWSGCSGSGYACSGAAVVACSGSSRCSGGLFGGRLFNRNRCHGAVACSGWAACSGSWAGCAGGWAACSSSVGCVVTAPAVTTPAATTPAETKPADSKPAGEKKPEGGAQPPEAAANKTAKLIVSLPETAKLFINDVPTVSTSDTRTFVSPELTAGKDYYYTLKAEIVRDGQPVVVTRDVAVRAGETVRASFEFPTSVAAK